MDLVSPNQMIAAAKDEMLGGREPQGVEDWSLVMNFLAINIHEDCVHPACQLLNVLYNMGLTQNEVATIVSFQLSGSSIN